MQQKYSSIPSAYESGNALRQTWQAPALPEERSGPKHEKKVVVRQKLAVSPFVVCGIVVAAILFALVIGSYTRLFAATTENAALKSQLSELQQTNEKLQSTYESSYDMQRIETYAQTQLGMRQPNSSQIVYLDLSGEDQAVVLTESASQSASMVLAAFRESFEYLFDAVRSFFN